LRGRSAEDEEEEEDEDEDEDEDEEELCWFKLLRLVVMSRVA
jgi:hypothetical protein